MPRPRKMIEPETVTGLAALNLSKAEIGAVVGCNASTLTRRYAQAIEKGRAQARANLKRAQWDMAMGVTFEDKEGRVYERTPDPTMLIWLGKVVLGQGGDSELEVGAVDNARTAALPSDRERALRILGILPTLRVGDDDAPRAR